MQTSKQFKQGIFRFLLAVALIAISAHYSYLHAGTNSKNIDDLDNTLTKLVSFQTVSDNKKANQEALEWVRSELQGLPLRFKNFNSNGFPSMVITTQNTKSPKLWLVGHMDVVPADPSMFTMTTIGNKLHGRGVLDMKLGAACYIEFLKELGPNLKDYDIGVMLTSDEEVGGMNGVRYLLDNEGYRGKFGFLPDGGFDWKIEEDAKGLFWVKFKVQGVASHGSRPWLGVNAINNLMSILHEVNAYFDKLKSTTSNKDYYTTVNVGLINGGKAVNQVPDYAEATVDIRYTHDFDINQFKKTLDEFVKKVPHASYEILVTGNPNHLNLDQAEVKQFQEIAKKMYGIEVGSTKSHGATDARFFSEKGISVMIVTPNGGDIHSKDEWMSKDDFHRFYNVFKAWASSVGRINQ